ncbi:hypothetical protein J2751_001138 [Halorubrum alkaliphilum]|uniref:Uncharacterized protein n=1 Tax=Halorubrum alkaliphilum TaxID=261290 RepID=A0A8T4GDE3_9EURY|nr:hypothetical protein [Halorubrum alkaliphilum]MBP1922133.1 hypothetical protein [Halorubrum alkaliphilum]
MVHDPLTLREAAETRLGNVLVLFSVLTFVYSLMIIGQVLIGLVPVVGLAGAYLTYRGLAVADSIADAAQRYAAVKEREVDLEDETPPREVGTDPTERTTTRLTDREE